MSVETTGGGLSWDARLNTEQLEQDANKATRIIEQTLEKAAKKEKEVADKIKRGISKESVDVINDSVASFSKLDDSYKRIFNNITNYQNQLEKLATAERELQEARRTGVVTQDQYNQQVTALRQKSVETQKAVKGLADELARLEKPVKVDTGLSQEALGTIAQASKSFDDLAPNMQAAINQMVILENEFEQLQRAEAELTAQFSKGALGLNEYNRGIAQIRASMLNTRAALKNTAMEVELNRAALSGEGLNRGWNGLGNSISQISRELPAFAFSAQTGFLALSNNIPILADEIDRLRQKNQTLAASGQKSIPIWKQVVTGFLSWQALLPILITLLTVYSNEILNYVKSLFGMKKAIDQVKQSQEILNAAFEDSTYAKAIQDVNNLRVSILLAQDGLKSASEVVDQYNESIGKVTGEVNSLNEAEQELVKNADKFIQSQFLKAAATAALEQSTQKAVEAGLRRQELERELIEAGEDLQKALNAPEQISGTGATSNITNLEQKIRSIGNSLNEVNQESQQEIDSLLKLFQDFSVQAAKLTLNPLEEEATTNPDSNQKVAAILDGRKNLLDKISELDRQYARIQLSDDEAELQALRDKFNEVRQLVNEFNSDPRNAKVQIEVEAIDRIQADAEKELIFKQETQALSDEYEKRKSLYQEYEAFVRDFGIEQAQKRYGGEFDLAKEYLSKIQAEYDKINTIPVEDRTGSQNERLKLFKRVLDQEAMEQEQAYLRNLKSFLDFNQRRQILEENYQQQRAEIVKRGDLVYLEEFDRQFREQQAKLNDEAFKKGSGLNEFFANVETMARDRALEEVKRLREELEKFDNLEIKDGGISDELVSSVKTALDNIERNVNEEIPAGMIQWASALEDVAGSLAGVNSELGQIVSSVAQAVRSFAQIKNLTSELKLARDSKDDAAAFTASANLVSVAATSLIGIFNLVSKAAKQRKEAEEKYYKSIIGLQQDYNLALNEQIRIRASLNENVFGVTDYQAELNAGYDALLDAESKYNDALEKLADARVKIGTRNKIDLGSVAGSAALGAIAGTAIGAIATGAAIGSIVPGIGTIIGAGVGATIGLFATKKKENTYGSLLEEFPDLVREGADGLIEINRELAEALIANDLLDDKTKELVEDVLNWEEAVRSAREQIAGVIGDLVGQIGGDLQSSLVNAFRSGEDAAEAMADSVEKAIERMISNLLFSAIFKEEFDKLQEELTGSLDPLGGDQNVLDDFQQFYQGMADKLPVWEQALQAAQQAGSQFGFDLFKPENNGTNAQRGLSGAIRRELTEETAGELAGLFRGQFDVTKRLYQVAVDQLAVQLKIEVNTYVSSQELKLAVTELKKISKNTDPASARGEGLDG